MNVAVAWSDRPSVDALLRHAVPRLRAAGVDTARLDAEVLLAHATGMSRAQLFARGGQLVTAEEKAAFERLIDRRAHRVPVSRLLGFREFWGLRFEINHDVLDPRPDTETVVEAALAATPDRNAPLRVLDLGTGSGCLLLALLSERPRARGVGIDRSQAAALVARRNAIALGLGERTAFAVGDWCTAVTGPFDLVLSNPPYVVREQMAGLPPEVAGHDPALALDGGPDGLGAYRRIALDLPRLLRPGGVAVLELGAGQAEQVARIVQQAGLRRERLRRDLAGHPRCLVASL